MNSEPDFKHLIAKVFAGDAEAAAELVRKYEPEIRRVIRFRLNDPRMRRILDTADICQSVFARFFFRAGMGQFDLNSPADLIRLLSVMATNRLIDQHRREQTKKRSADAYREVVKQKYEVQVNSVDDSPAAAAEYNELLAEVRSRLSSQSLDVSDRRLAGKSWTEIAVELGERSDTVRKRFERDCHRAMAEMGIEG